MSEPRTLTGLNCPRCGGTIPVPEGQAIVQCPYCDLRALVRGERGVRRFQVPCRVDHTAAAGRLGQFLGSNLAIAFNARQQARLSEQFLAYLPFWTTWARVLGWVFGQDKQGSGKNERWVPKECQVTEDMTWTGAACDVGEFGVHRVELTSQTVEPFDAEALHAAGLVFEPVTSISEAQTAARQDFEGRVRQQTRLDRVAQSVIRFVNERFGVVYYPLWVLRYLYRGRAFQVVVDGYSGQVLYGKAPGNTLYRAAVLVGGMAAGALVAVDVAALILGGALNSSSSDNGDAFGAAVVVFLVGLGIMFGAYSAFRYGEVYEFQKYRRREPGTSDNGLGRIVNEAKKILGQFR
ncbi:MAG: hypothetical protein JNK29_08605 [Anaerolineales bacterium]|nr:hypothetical protein [Anaerolineales bacterium]